MSVVKRIGGSVLRFFRRVNNALFGGRHYTKFIIITRSRTGSNFLVSLLNAHPQVEAGGELFAQLKGRTTQQVWSSSFDKKSKKVQCAGFKIFYYHPLDSDSKAVWDKIKNDRSIRIIHLKRSNILETLVSRKIAVKTDVWLQSGNVSTPSIEERKVTLTPEECLKEFESTRANEHQIDEQYQQHQLMELKYEELVADTPAALSQVFQFLGVKPVTVSSSLRKQNKESLSELMTNYTEIKEALNGTEWAYMLND